MTEAKCLWYVSKYVVLPGPGNPIGSRGFRLMAELARMGHVCVVITSDSNHLAQNANASEEPYRRELMEGVEVITTRTFKATRASSWQRIVSWLDFEWRLWRMPLAELPRPDAVVVSSLSLLTIVNGFRLRRRLGARLVFEVRDIWPLTLTEEGGYSKWNPWVRALGVLERWGYRSSDAIVGTMPNLCEHVQNVLRQPKPVACIPMGVARGQALAGEPLADEVRDLVPQGKFIVTYAGTIGITNALETLMEVAAASHASGDGDMHFLVVGDGDLKADYQRKFGHLPNLTFLPKIPKEQVPTILRMSDVLYFSVYRSRVWRYGQSLNKLIDYMASGKPIVGSYSGYPSMINEADSGTFVPAADASAALSELRRYRDMTSAEREEIGTRGRSWLWTNRSYRTLAVGYLGVLTGSVESPSLARSGPGEVNL